MSDVFDTTPFWLTSSDAPVFPALDRDLSVDAVVIGGGITGVTAAYLLKEAGLTVALLERDRCGRAETAHTTGHLTFVTDRSLPDMVSAFGRHQAQLIWEAGRRALDEIDRLVEREAIDCGFSRVPGYIVGRLDGPTRDTDANLHQVADEARACGFDAEYVRTVPGLAQPGTRFDRQARFHPLRYLYGLAAAIPGHGSYVFEESRVDEVVEDPRTVRSGDHRVAATFVLLATHLPIVGSTPLVRAALLQADLYPYSTYAVGARVARGPWPEALFWDLQTPYHYLRVDRAGDHDGVIVGGADHKTGQSSDTVTAYRRVERVLQALLPGARVTARWSGQIVETRDGLPYIGETVPGQFVVTGGSGNGLTFGTIGAMMARDAALGRANVWSSVFDVNRTRVTEGLWHYIRENTDLPYYLVRDRFAGPEGRSLADVGLGEGRLIDLRGTRVAAYRDARGRFSLLSPLCPHLGCHVAWNPAESTWDCPCHGSRFGPTGTLLSGPADRDLSSYEED